MKSVLFKNAEVIKQLSTNSRVNNLITCLLATLNGLYMSLLNEFKCILVFSYLIFFPQK